MRIETQREVDLVAVSTWHHVVVPRQPPEQAISRWLTHVVNDASRMAASSTAREDPAADAYYGAIADAFVATIGERIRFWADASESIDSGQHSKRQIESYVRRLRVVERFCTDERLRGLSGWGTLVVVAAALLVDPETAGRVWRSAEPLSVDEHLELLWAADELIFMIERENGGAIEFRPAEVA